MNYKPKLLILLLWLLFWVISSQAAGERVNRGAILELKDKIWVAAGQAGMVGFDGFENYWNCAPEGQKPNVFCDYYDFWNMNEKWSHELKEELLKFHRQGYFVVPQIGIDVYFWQSILDGSLDDELDNFIKGLKHLAIPAFIRIGYEFNNPPPEVYTAEQFKQVYIKIAKKIKESGLEMACVWNISISGQLGPIRDFYPDNKYVDWVSFNIYSSELNGGNLPLMDECIAIGNENNKPILIGEASNNTMGQLNNQSEDYGFWGRYFLILKEKPGIKQTMYVNWDWDIQELVAGTGFHPWGDSRLQTAESQYVNAFFEDLSDPVFFHATSEIETRKQMGYNDEQAPTQVVNLKRNGNHLTWDPVIDNGGSNLAHYTIYRDGKIWDYSIDPEYEVKYLSHGGYVDVQISAIDRAGNESEKSTVLQVRRNATTEMIWDGDFNYPPTRASVDWRWMGIMDNNAKLPPDDIAIDTTGKLDGKNSCLLNDYKIGELNNWWQAKPNNPKDWKLQLFQLFQVQQGEKYTITFQALAKEPRTIRVYFMDNHVSPKHSHQPSPIMTEPPWDDGQEWEYYEIWNAKIDTFPKDFKYEAIAPVTETARLSFMMGNCEPTTIWLDKVSVLAGQGTDINHDDTNFKQKNKLHLQVFAIKTQNIAKIIYTLPEKSRVSAQVFTSKGRLINSFINPLQSRGNHAITMKTEFLSPGIYLIKLNACNSLSIKKLMLIR